MNELLSEIERELPQLRRFARSLTRDGEAADDLVHDCVARALAGRAGKRPGTSTRAWLYTILRNLHVDGLRRHKTRGETVPLDGLELGDDADVLQQVYVRQVLDAVDTLTPEHREVLVLAAVEGLSYAEIAAVVGIPLGTVMSRLSRARENLTARLARPQAAPQLTRIK